MKQQQSQIQSQRLSLSRVMRTSLALLSMGPEEISREINRELKRNPFLTLIRRNNHNKPSKVVDQDLPDFENPISKVEQQLGLLKITPKQSEIAYSLLHSLDERGFLIDELVEVASYLNCEESEIVQLLPILQNNIEPVGVFARSLSECFAIQLKAKNRYDPIIERLLERLDLVAEQDIKKICDEINVDEEDAIEMVEDLRNLDPVPLKNREELFVAPDIPEILFTEINQEIIVELNLDAFPDLLTDDAFFSTTTVTDTDRCAQQYYHDCYRETANLVKALQSRANTLLLIGNYIAQVERKFILSHKERDRVSLTFGFLAKNTGLNKSTVSRALQSCRIRTDKGTFPAKYFFARGINNNNPGGQTRENVLRRLSILVETEDQYKPLSDAKLAEQLHRFGLEVSRRTIVKYRKLLGIKNVSERRIFR